MRTRDELNDEFLNGCAGELRAVAEAALDMLWRGTLNELGDPFSDTEMLIFYEQVLEDPQTRKDLEVIFCEYSKRKKELSLVVPLERIDFSLNCLISIINTTQKSYFKSLQDTLTRCIFMFLWWDLDDLLVLSELLEGLRSDIVQLTDVIQIIIEQSPDEKWDIEGVELRINVVIDYLQSAIRENDRIKSAFKTFNLI